MVNIFFGNMRRTSTSAISDVIQAPTNVFLTLDRILSTLSRKCRRLKKRFSADFCFYIKASTVHVKYSVRKVAHKWKIWKFFCKFDLSEFVSGFSWPLSIRKPPILSYRTRWKIRFLIAVDLTPLRYLEYSICILSKNAQEMHFIWKI